MGTILTDLRLFLLASEPQWTVRPAADGREVSTAAAIRAAHKLANREGAVLVDGGEPLRRSDLPELLRQLVELRGADLGICTTGEPLNAATAQRLHQLGVTRLVVPFHSARADAHDWLVGRSGALRSAHRALLSAREAGLHTIVEVAITRPTAAHLAETIEVLARLGVRRVCFRRPAIDSLPIALQVPTAARLSLIEADLERAAAVALERRMRLTIRDLPLCSAPRLRRLFAPLDSELWITAEDGRPHAPETEVGCPSCPGAPICAGAPADYVARFGWEELGARHVGPRADAQSDERAPSAQGTTVVFSWRGPHRVRCEACGDQTPNASHGSRTSNEPRREVEHIHRLHPPHEPSRVVRARLVQTARTRPALLRLVGADLLAHPQAPLLIYDALRLFPRVSVAGEASPIIDWSDLDLRRLKDLHRLDVALYGFDAASHDAHCGIPGAFATMMRAVERLRSQTSITVGAYAILHDADALHGFVDAWQRGELPGEPRFRLSSRGGSLDELIAYAAALEPGAARAALLAVLPHCLLPGTAIGGVDAVVPGAQQRLDLGRVLPYQPCGSDPFGAFELRGTKVECCAVAGCPGIAVGWQSRARTEQWSMST